MAEFAASLVTIGELAFHLSRVSRRIYSAYRHKKVIGEEVKFVFNAMDLASGVFENAVRVLEQTKPSAEELPVVQRYESDNRLLRPLNRCAKYLTSEIKLIPETIDKGSSMYKVFYAYMWKNHQMPKVMLLMQKIQFVQTSVTMIQNTVQLELNQRDARVTTDSTYRVRLENEITTLRDELQTLERRVMTQARMAFDISSEAIVILGMTPRNFQRSLGSLVDLSKSIRSDEHVVVNHSAFSRTPSLEPSSTSISTPLTTSISPPSGTESPEVRPREIRQRQHEGDGQRRSANKFEGVVARIPSRTSHPTPTTVHSAPTSMTVTDAIPEDGYVSVRAWNNNDIVIDLTSAKRIEFYESLSSSDISHLAYVVKGLPRNLMSLGTAQQLDIKFVKLGGDVPLTVRFGDKKRSSLIGQTGAVKINTGSEEDSRILSLEFLIYADSDAEIILGDPFIEQRQYYYPEIH